MSTPRWVVVVAAARVLLEVRWAVAGEKGRTRTLVRIKTLRNFLIITPVKKLDLPWGVLITRLTQKRFLRRFNLEVQRRPEGPLANSHSREGVEQAITQVRRTGRRLRG